MRRLANWVGVILFAAAALARAATDPFPDQPDALSKEEIAAATVAMKAQLGKEAAPPLLASGKRAPEHVMPSYALFATPLKRLSSRVQMRRQVICNYFRPMSGWQCTRPQDYFRMTVRDIEHAFTFQVMAEPGNRRAALESVEYVYSQCFWDQLAAIGGKPFTPSPDADFVNSVLDDGKGFTVITGPLGDKDSYRLEKTDKGMDGCGFRMIHARLGGAVLPAGYAKELEKRHAAEWAKVEEQQRAREGKARRAASPGDTAVVEIVAGILMWSAWIVGLLTLVLPWTLLAKKGRRAAATTAGILAGACTLFAVASAILVPAKYNIRIDLLISGAVVIMAWMVFAALALWAATGKK